MRAYWLTSLFGLLRLFPAFSQLFCLLSKATPSLDLSGIVQSRGRCGTADLPVQESGGIQRVLLQRTRRLGHALLQRRRAIGSSRQALLATRHGPGGRIGPGILATAGEPVIADLPG